MKPLAFASLPRRFWIGSCTMPSPSISGATPIASRKKLKAGLIRAEEPAAAMN